MAGGGDPTAQDYRDADLAIRGVREWLCDSLTAKRVADRLDHRGIDYGEQTGGSVLTALMDFTQEGQ